MQNNYLAKILNHLLDTLYPFSYALISDELQAFQLVVDSFYRLAMEERELFQKLYLEMELEDKQKILFQIKLRLFKNIMQISCNRIAHFSFQETPEGYQSFYSLEIKERALLFLKHQADLETKDFQYIFGYESFDIINKLLLAKNKMGIQDII